jgi:two-component system, response regulator PdtaR
VYSKRSSLPVFVAVDTVGLSAPRPGRVFARERDAGSQKGPGQSARIVIVEDDYLVASEMEAALTEAGFSVAGVAGSAEEGIGLAASERPALVIMDIRLQGTRDGIDAAIELFQEHGIRSLFATAHGDPAVRRRAQAASPVGWVLKPYTMDALVRAVRRALRDLAGPADDSTPPPAHGSSPRQAGS